MQANKISDSDLQFMVPQMIEALKKLQTSSDWKKNEEKPCETFFRQEGDRIVVKGVKVISFTIEQIVQFMNDEKTFMKVNEQCIEHKLLHQIPGKFKITYTQMKLPWPMDNRQMVMLFTKHQQNSNKVYIVNKSVNYPYKQTKGVIRAQNIIGGFILQRVGQKQTKMTTFGNLDPKGSIPDLIKRQVAKKRGQAPAKIQQKMKQYFGK